MTDEDIELVTTFKYLGITLDTRLDWICHIDNKIKQAKKYLMMIQQGVYHLGPDSFCHSLAIHRHYTSIRDIWCCSMGTKVCYGTSGLQTSQNPTHGNDTCCPNAASHAHGWTRNNSWSAGVA
jgi:hypothetical protein